MDKKGVIKLFSYKKSEQENFPYIRNYMNLISPKIGEIENDEEKLKKFALAGLFLTYRAFNHWGRTMTTELDESFLDSIHTERIKEFKKYFGIEIHDSHHYLSLINCSYFCVFLWMFRI